MQMKLLSIKQNYLILIQTIEEESLRLIALHQPVASDMRTLGAILKIITYLNRIGRYGKDIAVITIEIGDSPHSSELVDIPLMATKVNKMLKDALHTLKTGDISIIESMSEKTRKSKNTENY